MLFSAGIIASYLISGKGYFSWVWFQFLAVSKFVSTTLFECMLWSFPVEIILVCLPISIVLQFRWGGLDALTCLKTHCLFIAFLFIFAFPCHWVKSLFSAVTLRSKSHFRFATPRLSIICLWLFFLFLSSYCYLVSIDFQNTFNFLVIKYDNHLSVIFQRLKTKT